MFDRFEELQDLSVEDLKCVIGGAGPDPDDGSEGDPSELGDGDG